MTWRLYLDDLRTPSYPPPEFGKSSPEKWLVCRSSEQARLTVLSMGEPYEMSLDHDLGGDDTSMVFLRWLSDWCLDNRRPMPKWRVHSANPVGVQNIASFMRSWESCVD